MFQRNMRYGRVKDIRMKSEGIVDDPNELSDDTKDRRDDESSRRDKTIQTPETLWTRRTTTYVIPSSTQSRQTSLRA